VGGGKDVYLRPLRKGTEMNHGDTSFIRARYIDLDTAEMLREQGVGSLVLARDTPSTPSSRP
jgi:hypothetical protein